MCPTVIFICMVGDRGACTKKLGLGHKKNDDTNATIFKTGAEENGRKNVEKGSERDCPAGDREGKETRAADSKKEEAQINHTKS